MRENVEKDIRSVPPPPRHGGRGSWRGRGGVECVATDTNHLSLPCPPSLRGRRKGGILAILIGGLTLDLLSMVSWGHPAVAGPLLAVIALAVAVAACWDIRLGVAAVLLELLWGSHGRLIAAPMSGFSVSLRMTVYASVLLATAWHLRKQPTRAHLWTTMRTHPARWPALAFGASVLLALIVGALRHPTARWFTDANAWAFLLLAPAFLIARIPGRHCEESATWQSHTSQRIVGGEIACVPAHAPPLTPPARKQGENHSRTRNDDMTYIALVGALYLIFRTYLLLFLFSHDLGGTWIGIYQWVRDTRLGEVTVFPGGFPRVFLPSMVLLLIAIPLAAMRMRTISPPPSGRGRLRGGGVPPAETNHALPSTLLWFIFGCSIALLTISLSRSYWVGLAVLIGVGLCIVIRSYLFHIPHSLIRTNKRMVVWAASSVLLGFTLAVAVVRLPWPQPLTTAGFGATLAARFAHDAAVSNRWQQIDPLRAAIIEHPILGSGFGAAVTYESKDPRTLAAFPYGRYTTTAFEWGYLDDLLERGIIGLLVELWFIGSLIWYGLRCHDPPPPAGRGGKGGWGSERCALAIGLLAITVVHATSPYLNHPLGIGAMLLLVSVWYPHRRGGAASPPAQ